jgi:hypothetical protein
MEEDDAKDKEGKEADNSALTPKGDDGILCSKDDPVEDEVEDQNDDTDHKEEDDHGDGDDDNAAGHGSASIDGIGDVAVVVKPVKVPPAKQLVPAVTKQVAIASISSKVAVKKLPCILLVLLFSQASFLICLFGTFILVRFSHPLLGFSF